jgi:ABC-2 type transport system permease protein
MPNNLKKNLSIILLVLAVNLISVYIFFRIDLTQDKKYSLSEATENMLQNLSGPVQVKVYLDGDGLPGGFERLKKAIEETLVEFKIEGGKNLNYQFINPYAQSTEEKRNALFKELIDKGMQPTNIYENVGGKKSENLIFPYATISYEDKEKVVLLLKSNQAADAQTKLNQAYENVEYTLASTIKKLTNTEKKKIGLLTEFTSLKPINFAGLITSLQENYDLFIINATQSPTFEGLDALILPKPDRTIDDSTKFKIDQYIMSGGKALFFVDGLNVDTMGLEGSFAKPLDINMDDMFFKYGLRINKNIIKDGLNAAVIPLVVGNMGDRPNIQPVPFRYFPLINNFGDSPITKNLDMVFAKFTADIDIVNKNDGLTKTPLLKTSEYTKVLNAPALITYNEARTDTEQAEYNKGVKTIAYLVSGEFSSLFANSFSSSGILKKSPQTQIMVCSDGDIIVNEVDKKSGNPFPLGFDKLSQHQFGNQDFVMNTLDFMLNENGLIASKNKSVEIRPLDKLKTRDDRNKWQLINTILPLGLLAIIGFVRFYLIRKKYSLK